MATTLNPEHLTTRTTAVAGSHHNRSREERSRQSQERFTILLEKSPIIPAVRSPEYLVAGSHCPGKIVYFLFGDPESSGDMMKVIADAGKVPIINIDLAAGLARDHAAVSYLARRSVQGIISTHPEPLRAARELELFAIKRTFLLDSAALDSALRSLDQFMPDALEVLPAMAAPYIVKRLHALYPTLPVIAGGLVTTLREIDDLIKQGITAVSASNPHLWIA